MKSTFVSGLYRPNEDAREQPKGNIRDIVDSAIANKRRRRALRQSYRTRSMDCPGDMAAIKRATARMVGSE